MKWIWKNAIKSNANLDFIVNDVSELPMTTEK